VRGPLEKYLFGCRVYNPQVQFPRQVNQQDIQHIAGTAFRVWPRGGVQLLRDLLTQIQATNRRRYWQSHRSQAADRRFHEIDGTEPGRTKINLNYLPRTGPVSDSEFQAERVRILRAQRIALQLKAALVESQRQRVLKNPVSVRSLACNVDVDIFCRTRTLRKAEFHRDPALRLKVVQAAMWLSLIDTYDFSNKTRPVDYYWQLALFALEMARNVMLVAANWISPGWVAAPFNSGNSSLTVNFRSTPFN